MIIDKDSLKRLSLFFYKRKMRRGAEKIVSLLEFIKTGKLDCVALGWTMEDVLTNFCKPDDKNDMGHGMYIWRYSTFELHFADNELFLLWCDGLRWLKNPTKKQFKFDKWLFKDTSRLTFSYFCSVLTKLDISFSVKGTFYDKDKTLPSNVMLLVDNTDVVVYFEDYEDECESIEQYQLVAIGATKSHPQHNVREL